VAVLVVGGTGLLDALPSKLDLEVLLPAVNAARRARCRSARSSGSSRMSVGEGRDALT
jgi:hypothetical protein